MPELTINGKQIEVPAGTRVIDAAEKLGIHIPRFCYHPALSVVANCRMCFVELGDGKLVPSCATPVAAGMTVLTESEKVKEMRRAVLEFILINHPIDCPVCDQAGECFLQDYFMNHGLYHSRLKDSKLDKRKVVDLGKNVILDEERCVLCTRCVRFCDEVTGTGELGQFSRGSFSTIGTFPGRELENNYSGNLVDICPVGALTDKDFRFKCRVWYLQEAESICPLCSQGCNIKIHYSFSHGEEKRVMRIKPKYNPEVNGYWICDRGRYGYPFIDENRLLHPQVRKKDKLENVSWEEAVSGCVEKLSRLLMASDGKGVGIIMFPALPCEDMFVFKKVFMEAIGFKNVDFSVHSPDASSDNLLLKADKFPNRMAAKKLELFSGAGLEKMLREAEGGHLKGLFVIGGDLFEIYGEKRMMNMFLGLDTLIYQGAHMNPTAYLAHVVLPSCVYAEREGTFVNHAGKIQSFKKAFAPLGESREDWGIFRDMGEKFGRSFLYNTISEICSDHEYQEIFGSQGEQESVKGSRGQGITESRMVYAV